MSVTVVLPTALRELADGEARLELGDVATVADALRRLHERLPGVYDRVMTEAGALRPHVNVFVGPRNIRWSGGLATAVPDGAEVLILPAVSGG